MNLQSLLVTASKGLTRPAMEGFLTAEINATRDHDPDSQYAADLSKALVLLGETKSMPEFLARIQGL